MLFRSVRVQYRPPKNRTVATISYGLLFLFRDYVCCKGIRLQIFLEFSAVLCNTDFVGGLNMFVSGMYKCSKMVCSVQMDNGGTLCGA